MRREKKERKKEQVPLLEAGCTGPMWSVEMRSMEESGISLIDLTRSPLHCDVCTVSILGKPRLKLR